MANTRGNLKVSRGFENVAAGDIMYFLSKKEFQYVYGRNYCENDRVQCTWATEMDRTIAGIQFRKVHSTEVERLKEYGVAMLKGQRQGLILDNRDAHTRWRISADMIKIVKEGESIDMVLPEIVNENNIIDPTLSFRTIGQKDPAILAEMISKVRREDVRTCLRIMKYAAFHNTDKENSQISDEIVDAYLKDWAEAKYEFYLMFGKEFTQVKEIEMQRSKSDFHIELSDLKNKYLKYFLTMSAISVDEFYDNRISRFSREYSSIFGKMVSRDMKTTKFLSKLFEDKEFDMDLSKLYQEGRNKKDIVLSIDPMDFFTMSENKHDWSSCMALNGNHGSDYHSGLLQGMLDDSTVVSYLTDLNKSYKYEFNNQALKLSFEHNSKHWRTLVYISKDHSTFVTSKPYPCQISTAFEAVSALTQELINKTLGKQVEFNTCEYFNYDNDNEDPEVYLELDIKNDRGYLDLNHGADHCYIIYPKILMGKELVMNVSSMIYCLWCGKESERSAEEECRRYHRSYR